MGEIDDRFRSLADSAPVLMWMSGIDAGCTFLNKGWLDFTGRSLEQELGSGWSQGVHADDLEACLTVYRDAFQARREFEMEYRLRRHDGHYRWIRDTGVPRIGPDGSFLGYMGSAYDITELKQAEDRSRQVLEAAPSGMIVVTREGAITQVNAAVEAIFGYPRDELLGRPIEALVPERFCSGHLDARHGFQTAPTARAMGVGRDLFGRRKDGSEVPVEIGLTPIETASGSFVLASVIDITARKETERALADAARQAAYEKQLADGIIENLPGFLFMVDREGQRVRWNKHREHVTGYSADEIGATPPGGQSIPEDREAVVAAIERGFREGHARVEHRIRTKDGRLIPILSQGSVVKILDQEYLLGVGLDISPLKQAEEQLRRALGEVHELKARLELENAYLQQEVTIGHSHDGVVGESKPIRHALTQVEQVAGTGAAVLVFGETGVGKELIVRRIHQLSLRGRHALIKMNCAALPSALVESELFGREKGAYTGALTRQSGRFEVAHKSTIFLDEVGELPLELQVKLLRVLQDGEFERLGSTTTIKVDVRVIAATNRDLAAEVRAGRFREDLFYRLNVFPIWVPPLRERPEDIPLLVWAFVREFGSTMGKRVESISRKALDALAAYSWPGNVRELRNVIERAMILSSGTALRVEVPAGDMVTSPTHVSQRLSDVERAHIGAVLERVGWRIRGPRGAAHILGLKPTTLEARMAKLGIKRSTGQTNAP